ncbi:TonB-dependent receptor [candidate division KSB1 bacterium]|nr:TonB-dependent receptor [candidate division KSB1 bacterium]
MRKLIIVIFYIVMLSRVVVANPLPTTTVSGFVYDKSNGEAMIGANVFLANTVLGSSSNVSGYYVIPKIPPGEYQIICDYIGYKLYKKNIRIQTEQELKLNIILETEALMAEEVVVTADSERTVDRMYNKPISEIQLAPRQLKQIPQIAEADLLRSLQTLPGIVSVSDFSSGLYVRGGTPDQNLFLLDGTDVYNPEHMFGLFSTFNTEAIKQVNFSKGGFGAEYGGRLSSILDVTNIDGNREEFEGSASLSAMSAKSTLQMPVGDRGSISGSFRRTYFDKVVAKFIDDMPDYYYYDGNVKAFFDLNKNNKLTISGYGGRDFLDVILNNDATEKIGFQYNWGNKTSSVRWTRIFTPQLFSNFWITGSRYSSMLDMLAYDAYERNVIKDITVKGNLEYHYSNKLGVKFGFEQKDMDVLYRQTEIELIIDIHDDPTNSVAYFTTNWRPTPLFEIEAGVRYNRFTSDTTFQDWEPRLSMKYRLTDKINLKAAGGVYHQYLHRVPRFVMADIWTYSNKYQVGASANHAILGYQQEISDDYEFEIETYYKDYKNIYSFSDNIGAEIEATSYSSDGVPILNSMKNIFKRGEGYSYGFEALLRKDVGDLTGWIGYSYSKTLYKIDGINQNRYFSPRHDRTSTLNAVMNYCISQWKGEWTLGSNFVYSTGQPFTEPGSAYLATDTPVTPWLDLNYAPTKINNIRLPYYARLDVSLTYRKQFKTWTLEPFIQVYNVGNRKNVWFVNYDYENGIPEIEANHMLPLLPTLGVNVKF